MSTSFWRWNDNTFRTFFLIFFEIYFHDDDVACAKRLTASVRFVGRILLREQIFRQFNKWYEILGQWEYIHLQFCCELVWKSCYYCLHCDWCFVDCSFGSGLDFYCIWIWENDIEIIGQMLSRQLLNVVFDTYGFDSVFVNW